MDDAKSHNSTNGINEAFVDFIQAMSFQSTGLYITKKTSKS